MEVVQCLVPDHGVQRVAAEVVHHKTRGYVHRLHQHQNQYHFRREWDTQNVHESADQIAVVVVVEEVVAVEAVAVIVVVVDLEAVLSIPSPKWMYFVHLLPLDLFAVSAASSDEVVPDESVSLVSRPPVSEIEAQSATESPFAVVDAVHCCPVNLFHSNSRHFVVVSPYSTTAI